MKSACYTYFCIKGNFEPDKITKLLELTPEKVWRIGDRRRNGLTYTFSFWQFGTCSEYDYEVDRQMMKTIAPLISKIPVLQKIKKQYDVVLVLEIVPTITPDESTPCLSPSMEVMKFCVDSGTEIDIDLYVNSTN